MKGAGRVTGALTNTATGNVRVRDNQAIHFDATAASSNAGLIEVIEGEIEFDGALTNSASTGLIAARDAALRFGGGLTNGGSLALSFGTSDVFGDITNNVGATIVVSGGANATFYDDIIQNGTFRVSQVGSTTSVAVVLGAFTGSGGSTGGGDIFFEGDLRPGNSPASVTFANNISFGSTATLQIELGGTVAGTQYDQIIVVGDLALDGTLDVSLINSFNPVPGDEFGIVNVTGSQIGTFQGLVENAFVGNFGGTNLFLTYAAGDGNDIALLAALPGDHDLDGDVDGRDFLAWQRGESPNPFSPGDLAAWQANYGVGSLTSALRLPPSALHVAVPEPWGLILVCALFALMPARLRCASPRG